MRTALSIRKRREAAISRSNIPELAAGLHHHVYPRTAELLRRYQADIGHAAEAVVDRLDSQHVEYLGYRRALCLNELAAPQGVADLAGQGVTVPLTVEPQGILSQGYSLLPGTAGRGGLGVHGEEVATGRQGIGIGHGITSGRGRGIAAVQGVEHTAQLGGRAFQQGPAVVVHIEHGLFYLSHRPGKILLLLRRLSSPSTHHLPAHSRHHLAHSPAGN